MKAQPYSIAAMAKIVDGEISLKLFSIDCMIALYEP
jgi:hypothetical protein